MKRFFLFVTLVFYLVTVAYSGIAKAAGGDFLWRKLISNDPYVVTSGSMAMGKDGTLYLSAQGNDGNGALYAFSSNGASKWVFNSVAWGVGASPSVGPNGSIFVGMYNAYLYSITPYGGMN